ncbi:MAG: hypothetical protein HQK51_21170 [Oligoflexia bacterium]|nr:hypothetical protein [Oligoflexia bacterium]
MKHVISNIAYEPEETDDALMIIKESCCDGIEVAPGLVWSDYFNTSESDWKTFKDRLAIYDLNVLSFQGLFFEQQNVEIFLSRKCRLNFVDRIIKLAKILQYFGGGPMAMGSPHTRKRFISPCEGSKMKLI